MCIFSCSLLVLFLVQEQEVEYIFHSLSQTQTRNQTSKVPELVLELEQKLLLQELRPAKIPWLFEPESTGRGAAVDYHLL